MEEARDYTGFAIENILHPIIEAIEQGKGTPEEKAVLKKQAFQKFFNEAKQYSECDRLKKMTLEQLQEEYERLMGKQTEEER